MIYYKVKKQFDNAPIIQKKAGYVVKIDIWIRDELYTLKELQRMQKRGVIIPWGYFEIVEIPKNKVYCFFGARFQMGS